MPPGMRRPQPNGGRLRIGIQLSSFRPGEVGGQGVFVRRLLRQLVSLLGGDRIVLFLRPELSNEAAALAVRLWKTSMWFFW